MKFKKCVATAASISALAGVSDVHAWTKTNDTLKNVEVDHRGFALIDPHNYGHYCTNSGEGYRQSKLRINLTTPAGMAQYSLAMTALAEGLRVDYMHGGCWGDAYPELAKIRIS